MKSYSMIYIGKIIDNLYENIEKVDKGIVFVKHYNTLNVSADDMAGLIPKDSNIISLKYDYQLATMPDAYEPWLKWLKEIYYKFYNDLSVEQFIDECGVYELQKSIFISYIKNGFCERWEEMVICEVQYECENFIASLVRAYSYILNNKKIFVVINKIHLAGCSIFLFLLELIKKSSYKNLSMIITYNDVYTMQSEAAEKWSKLQQCIEQKNMLFDWTMKDSQNTIETNMAFIPVEDKIEEYLIKANNMVYTLSIKDAIFYLDTIYNKVVSNRMKISEYDKYRLFSLYEYACICDGDANMGLHLCEMLNTLNITNQDYGYCFECICLESMVQGAFGQYTQAEKLAKEAIKIAKKIGDEHRIFRAELMVYDARFKGWHDLFACFFEFNIEESLIEKLQTKGYRNHLAYFYAFGFDNDESNFYNSKEVINNLSYFQKAISIAQELHNQFLIVEAYKKCITLASQLGYCEPVDYYYNKCLEILEREEDQVEIANIYSGLGYNRILSENYNQANEYFNSSINKLYELKMPEYIAEIIYNMSMNAFMAEDYTVASDYMISSIKIMNLLKISRLRVCNVTKMYGIIAISNMKLGVEYNCFLYLNLMKRALGHLFDVEDENMYAFWDDDLFLFYLVYAMLDTKDGNLKRAKENFDRAEFHMGRSNGILFFGYYTYAVELSKYYRLIDDEENAVEILNRCIDYCNSKGYTNKVERLLSVLSGNNSIIKKYDFSLTNVTLYDIYSLAEFRGLESEVKTKEKDIHFISLWQDLLNKDLYVGEEEMIASSIDALKSYYGVDRSVFIEVMEGNPIVQYCDKQINMTDKLCKEIVKKVSAIGRDFVANRISRSFDEYSSIIELFGKKDVVSMVGIVTTHGNEINNVFINYVTMYENFSNRQIMLNENNQLLFRCVFKQLIDAIERVRGLKVIESSNMKLSDMNMKLSKLAVTDQLTGLLNRQGLNRKIEDEFGVDYIGGKGKILTVMYVDLDNFKYYNDRFGHDIGDKILTMVSTMLSNLIGQDGYPVRYGGDEFVIILPYRKIVKAEEYAKCILYEISQETMYEKLGISKEEVSWAKRLRKTLSTSIGIAQAKECTADEIFIALKHADEALYYVKKNKKAGYKVWDKSLEELI